MPADWHHDTQHNDAQHNDTQHSDTEHNNKNDTQRKRHLMLTVVIMLSVAFKPIMWSVVILSVAVPAAQCNLHQCDALRTRLKC
jgi:hypothetical protein